MVVGSKSLLPHYRIKNTFKRRCNRNVDVSLPCKVVFIVPGKYLSCIPRPGGNFEWKLSNIDGEYAEIQLQR